MVFYIYSNIFSLGEVRVAEGIKLIKVNKVKEAMEHYKRALDMDPKYADGWFHVAEA